jgi:hypothetical protein
MKNGQFSAYINNDTQAVVMSKSAKDYEYPFPMFSPLCVDSTKKSTLESIQSWFEENFIPEERQIIINN